MGDLDVELFALIFFWVSVWGVLNILIQWIFEQMGTYSNPGVKMLMYLTILFASLYVLSVTLKEKNKKEHNKNKRR